MKLLELFCGTKSVSKVFKKYGYETFSIDIEEKFNPDLCLDILDFDIKMLPKKWRNPTVIWASPPCQTFSVASIYHYWENSKPKNYKTYLGLAIAKKTIEIIKELNPKYYFIENPTGMLRKQHFLKKIPRKTLTYCQYGETYRKSTDIWTNAINWLPRPPCLPGSNCHFEARRGSKTGIQGVGYSEIKAGGTGLKRCEMRAIIPPLLCEELVKVCNNDIPIRQTDLTGF